MRITQAMLQREKIKIRLEEYHMGRALLSSTGESQRYWLGIRKFYNIKWYQFWRDEVYEWLSATCYKDPQLLIKLRG